MRILFRKWNEHVILIERHPLSQSHTVKEQTMSVDECVYTINSISNTTYIIYFIIKKGRTKKSFRLALSPVLITYVIR